MSETHITTDDETVVLERDPYPEPADLREDCFSGCQAEANFERRSGIASLDVLFCWRPVEHEGDHYDASDRVAWRKEGTK